MNRPALVTGALGDQGGSAYYRVVLPLWLANQANMLQIRMNPQMAFFPIDVLQNLKPDTLIFHRSHTDAQRKYVNDVAHNLDAILVYTIDDWVSKVPKDSPHYGAIPKNADKEIKKVISLCDKLIVTNEVLANVYGYKKDTYIVPNYLPKLIWDVIYKTVTRTPRIDARPRIGWSGGIGHHGDLAILKEIAEILGDSVRWVFMGDIPPGFNDSNAEIRPAVNPTEYAKALYSLDLDIALAPLADHDFNRAKSNLRVLEYAACGYPVIASNVKTYRDTKATLVDYKAAWWAEKIKELVKDKEALAASGQALKDWVWENYTLEEHLEEYGNILSPDGVTFKPTVPEIEETVDILITTRNNAPVVKECIQSVIESIPDNMTKVEIVVSDNASDDLELISYLKDIEDYKITVLRSKEDMGYISSINKAVEVHPNRDVIILNSDTVVNGDWIDRLKKHSDQVPRVGSVTPFSNNATICSYPNPAGGDLETGSVKFYDSVVSTSSLDTPIELPTPVGFCMYMKRAALADVGLFDNHAFGRGYGEENDWALRASVRGWRNILGNTVYVGHKSGSTFGPEKQGLLEKAGRTLVNRWNQYHKLIEQWMQADPVGSLRQQLDFSAITKTSIQPRTLYIAHGFGGGLETYIQSQLAKNPGAIVLRNDPTSPGALKLEIAGETYHNLPTLNSKLTSMTFLQELLTNFRVDKISLQTTFGYEYNFPIWIQNLSKMLGIGYEVMLHDYWTICPRLRLVSPNSYCGEPSADDCNECVKINGSGVGQVDVHEWRLMYHKLLRGATKVMAPSHDLAHRLKHRYFKDIEIEVIPHETDIEIGVYQASIPYKQGDELKVAVIGSVSPDKGSLIVRDVAKYCADNKLPIKFLVFGNLIDNSAMLKLIPQTDNLRIFNSYEEEVLPQLMKVNPCHISFFPALWPETYSYTLSHAFKAGLPPVAFDIGAIAERIKEKNFGTVIPFDMKDDIPAIVEALQVAANR